jgi:hypothetical protein
LIWGFLSEGATNRKPTMTNKLDIIRQLRNQWEDESSQAMDELKEMVLSGNLDKRKGNLMLDRASILCDHIYQLQLALNGYDLEQIINESKSFRQNNHE